MIEYLFGESLFAWEMPEPNSGGKYGVGKDNGHLVNGVFQLPLSSGRLANVEIYLRLTAAGKIRFTNETTLPYLASKRIRCDELGIRLKSIIDLGDGYIVL